MPVRPVKKICCSTSGLALSNSDGKVDGLNKQVLKRVLWTQKGVSATVVTAGLCTHAELSSGHAVASFYSCCVHSLLGLCQLTS